MDRSGTDCTSLARRLKTSRSWIARSQRVTCSMYLVICVVVFICGFVVFMFLEPSVVYGVLSKSVRDMGGLAASVSLAVSVKYVRVGAGMEPHEVGSQRPGWVARARQRLRSAASVMLT